MRAIIGVHRGLVNRTTGRRGRIRIEMVYNCAMNKPQLFAKAALFALALTCSAGRPFLAAPGPSASSYGPVAPAPSWTPEAFVRLEIASGEDLRNESFGARRIVRVGDTSFIGYSELAGNAWRIRVRAYDHRSGILGPVREVASGTDDHSIMALAADSNGILHCVTGGHGAVIYTHTARPADASAWTPPETISPEGTYSMMVIDRADRLYVFYRSEWTNLEIRSRPPGGPWDAPVRIAKTTGNKGFYIMGIALGNEPGRQSLHVVGHFYGEPEAYGLAWPKESYGYRIRPWYIRSLDGGATWTKADGTQLPLPFSDTAIDVLFDRAEPYDIPWSIDIALDPANRPHVVCAWSERRPAPGLPPREVQAEVGRLPSRLQEWTWAKDGGWRPRDIATPALAGRHITHPTAVFSGETLHLFASTSEPAAARKTGETTVGRLWHAWSRSPNLLGEEILDEGTGYANVKLTDGSGALEVMWRGTPRSGAGKVALHYAAWPAAAFRASAVPILDLTETNLVIPQVDYAGALFKKAGDPYPHLDLAKVRPDRVVDKAHRTIVMENAFIRLTLLPEMGRIYSLIYKPTGHEVFWRNDIVTVGAAENEAGWWIWIGGAEFTLPGDEHGTTWAEPWTSAILENCDARKAVRMSVVEPKTGLREEIDISVAAGYAGFETRVRIMNPTAKAVDYAHWINPQWTPGGWNELTDGTEFIIPTDSIVIPKKYRAALGPSPQRWSTSPLRFIKGWDKGMGDLMADGLKEGFFGAYSHDEEEGVVRVFDEKLNPGLDVWTYGYHPQPPRQIPMGSGAPSRGYVEMWGGTSKTFPDERHSLAPGASIEWTEWMAPFQLTDGLTTADKDFAVRLGLEPGPGEADTQKTDGGHDHLTPGRTQGRHVSNAKQARLTICPAREFNGLSLRLLAGGRVLWQAQADISPDRPFGARIEGLGNARPVTLIIESAGKILLSKEISSSSAGPEAR